MVVEKILQTGERLRGWPVAGTTGYDFGALADGVFVDPAAAPTFAARYQRLTRREPDAAALAVACKREVLGRSFGAEVAAVARHLPGEDGRWPCRRGRAGRALPGLPHLRPGGGAEAGEVSPAAPEDSRGWSRRRVRSGQGPPVPTSLRTSSISSAIFCF